jgi:hypothetical protein
VGESDILLALAGVIFSAGGTAVISAVVSPPNRYFKPLVIGGGGLMIVSAIGFGLLLALNNHSSPDSSGPVVNGTGTTVTSIGQSGGITAGTYVNQAVLPQLQILSRDSVQNPDESETTIIKTKVVAPVTPGNLHIDVAASGIRHVEISTPPVDGVAMINMNHMSQGPNSFSADIPSPYGEYTITIQTAAKVPISLNSHF